MSYCTAVLKSNRFCSSKAKYILKEYNQCFCCIHALAQANKKMNTTYQTIADHPALQALIPQSYLSREELGEIMKDLTETHGYSLTVVSTAKVKFGHEITVVDNADYTSQYSLKVIKSLAYTEQYSNAASSYGSLLPNLTKPICVPIISYTQNYMKNGKPRICLVRGSKYKQWYYELSLIAHPLLLNDSKKLIIRLVELIKHTHDQRLVHGSIELPNLVQLKSKRISTTVFASLNQAMFWEGRYGQYMDENTSIDPDIKFDPSLCARHLNQEQYPCRYDDFESLLYLTMHLTSYALPWIGMADSDIANEKNTFLLRMAEAKDSPFYTIAKLIIDSHRDDRPDYDNLTIHFDKLVDALLK